jgi:translation initiation factor IF-2
MHDERGNMVLSRTFYPVSVLGLDGAATAGDKFNVFEEERSETDASKRSQLMRERQFVHSVILHLMK